MKTNRSFTFLLAVVLSVGLVAGLAGCTGASTEEIRGLLQGMEGKEMVITLDDGTVVRVTVTGNQAAGQAQQLVGEQVNVRVRLDGGQRQLQEVERRGRQEDQHSSGAIESIAGDVWRIGGREFKVTASTRLDGGLVVGVQARVEFITLADGTMQAVEIETDQEDEKFKGTIETMDANAWVIGGETFQVNDATRLDQGLRTGAVARVEFVTMADGTKVAVEIETDADDEHLSGIIETMTGDVWRIGGRDFRVNSATRLDSGLAVGTAVRVEFVTLSDGSMLATEIETDPGLRFAGVIESVAGNSWTVGGQTFMVNASTRLDEGLGAGRKARVRFFEQPDGSRLATRIQLDRSGPGGAEQRFEGAVESRIAETWVVGGKTFTVDQDTRIDGDPKVGDRVRVDFMTRPDGSMLATRISPR